MGALALVQIETIIKELRRKFEKAWCRDTCWHRPDFKPNRPSEGQCFVTALCIQDILGGDIICGQVDGIWHYWNCLPQGQEFDLTSDQFEFGDGIHRHPKAQISYMSRTPNRRCKRYLLLKKRLNAQKDLYIKM
jgi:hypothetical protein